VNTRLRLPTSRALRAAAALVALAGCSPDSGTTPGGPSGGVSIVRLTPASSELGLGNTLQLKLTALDAQENELAGTGAVWASADTTVAVVSQEGVVTARRIGVVQLQAVMDGKSAFSVISVVAPRVAGVAVTPAGPSVVAGATVQLAVKVTDGAGATLADRLVFWQSSNDGVARVTSTGLVNGVAAGTATITATSEGTSASVQVTVTAPAGQPAPGTGGSTPTTPTTPTTPAPTTTRVEVTPASASVVSGRTQQLAAAALDASGATRTGRSFTWTSSASGVATVNGNGLVTAVSPGTTTITARADGVSGTATITVTAPAPAPVARVLVTPIAVALEKGGKPEGREATLTATLFDESGRILTDRSCSWSGGESLTAKGKAVVQVVQLTATTARITSKSTGATTVSATCEGKSASAAVTVGGD
jgi:uncharacterized protein YjdB